MKNLDRLVTKLVDAMFEDIAHTNLVSAVCLVRSREIFAKAHQARGLPFFTITLPECSKLLEKALEYGELDHERPPYHGGLNNVDQRPKLLHSLWARVFTDSGQLLAEPDIESISLLRQVYNLFKALELDCDQGYVDSTVRDWIHIENELPRSHPDTWDSENPVWSTRAGHPLQGGGPLVDADPRQEQLDLDPDEDILSPRYDWDHFRALCGVMTSSLGEMDIWSIRPKHGPGAVSEGGKVRKYEFHTWPRKLQHVFPADWFTSHDLTDRTVCDSEPPARMIAVPKTQKGPRLIAAEPSAHQWIQGGIWRWLEERVRSSFLGLSIDFRSQENSRVLALEASKTQDYATVDLKSASDRLCTRLVEYVFQGHRDLLDALHASRSRSLKIPKGLTSFHGSDDLYILRKFAPQGSACTFPIQTIVFTMIAHMALCEADGDRDLSQHGFRRRAAEIRVFGDDIIIAKRAVGDLFYLLSELGLMVNKGKSFHKGRFRESCGMDAYDGVDVTPAKIRKIYQLSNPETLVSVIECSNNLYKKGMWRLADALLKTVPDSELKLIPVSRGVVGSVSLFTYNDAALTSRRRWNPDLHRV